jgi:hypothetical protein
VPGPPGGVHEEEVGVVVLIHIEEGDATAHGFGEEFFAVGTGFVGEVDSVAEGDVGKPSAWGAGGGGFGGFRCLDGCHLLCQGFGFGAEEQEADATEEGESEEGEDGPADGAAEDSVIVTRFIVRLGVGGWEVVWCGHGV